MSEKKIKFLKDLKKLSASDLARFWMKVTDLIPELELDVPLTQLAADYASFIDPEKCRANRDISRMLELAMRPSRPSRPPE